MIIKNTCGKSYPLDYWIKREYYIVASRKHLCSKVKFYENTIYIITGANGFLGNNVIRALRTREPDAEIRALILNGSDGEMLKGLDCKIFEGDVTNKESLKDIFPHNRMLSFA